MSNKTFIAETRVPLALSIRRGRWMISNMHIRIQPGIRLYRLIPGGPGCAETTWKCVFPKPRLLPPPKPYIKPVK